jgi:hypothetical protein
MQVVIGFRDPLRAEFSRFDGQRDLISVKVAVSVPLVMYLG